MEGLSADLWGEINQHLTPLDILLGVSRVSRKLYQTHRDERAWRHHRMRLHRITKTTLPTWQWFARLAHPQPDDDKLVPLFGKLQQYGSELKRVRRNGLYYDVHWKFTSGLAIYRPHRGSIYHVNTSDIPNHVIITMATSRIQFYFARMLDCPRIDEYVEWYKKRNNICL